MFVALLNQKVQSPNDQSLLPIPASKCTALAKFILGLDEALYIYIYFSTPPSFVCVLFDIVLLLTLLFCIVTCVQDVEHPFMLTE